MAKFSDHDAYIDAAPPSLQPVLKQLRLRLAKALPDTNEIMKYDMPGFGSEKSVIAGYAAFSKQCGLYVSKGAIAAHEAEIAAAGLKATKTGLKFSPDKPIPDDLIEKLARTSREEVED